MFQTGSSLVSERTHGIPERFADDLWSTTVISDRQGGANNRFSPVNKTVLQTDTELGFNYH